ncbi:MAG: dihydroxy-acid dehydratase [SAR202 cluster bacterium]|jgi:dihydroxy-acid dehydratase|nr:dihydroxy-acid dehydratase [SAR202 cluster bacterium]MQG75320.1 dihydroxy-acid dehydratase [SAR202 cluster bacterium]|tara:strand:- start:913 stop:2616 length:1704 start_codon:yes stop_codon:yes gene_type:complete
MSSSPVSKRSKEWFETPELYGWLRRAAFKAEGFDEPSYEGKPIIGICNTWSELTHCNSHLRDLAESVKIGVWQAGGFPMEFPVMSLGEYNMKPTTMLYRNLLSMDVEESITANPIDGVVLLGGCDKTTPALLMGAASADIPSILVTGGPQLKGNWKGEELGSCTDCRRYEVELRAGTITEDDWAELQSCIVRSNGHCMTMGTASTMATIGEALGMALPGNAAIPAVDSRRKQMAEAAGRQIVALSQTDLKPSKLMTQSAFENAIRCVHAIGGSTNAIIHLIAIAGRVGINLPLELFDELSKTTPFLLNLKPSGQYLMEDFYYAGGVPALMNRISHLLDLSNVTVTGKTLGENISGQQAHLPDVIRTVDDPLDPEGGLAVLYGNLAPTGAIIKPTAASPDLMVHTGRAVVFNDHDDLYARIDDPDLDVTPDDVLVMKNGGPIGAPGMPEWGFLPIPKKILATGVRDMVRISDARMSGTAFGTVVVHASPESANGGPLSAVEDGDQITLDVPNRRLSLDISESEMDARIKSNYENGPEFQRGFKWLHARHITQADKGCDFDFLRSEALQ